MDLPPDKTPLYNHPLHALEEWFREKGCEQDPQVPHCWKLHHPEWSADLCLEETVLRVEYQLSDQTKVLTFPYSLSRADVDQAVFEFAPSSRD
jgi:hypothetical protein